MLDYQIEMKLREIYQSLSDEFNFYYQGHIKIKISSRLRSSNGYIEIRRHFLTKQLIEVTVVMSKALLNEFGWDSFEKTFRHEIAHLANEILYNNTGHGESFKRLCQQFGGSMNRKMAGNRYSDCASKTYVKPIIKWIYTCGGCGLEKKMAKRMNNRKRGNSDYRCGKCRTTLDDWTEKRVG